MFVKTNTLSLLIRNDLDQSQSALNTAIQRLSSGLRINSAKDDAAGQAIANRFTANINGLSQAQRNANDGISLAQTTEGALSEVTNNLQRVRQLSVQAASGTSSDSDRQSIQAEINQRLGEIDRISQQTNFNGIKVLSSSTSALKVQVGAQDGQTIPVHLEEISARTLNLTGFNVDGSGTDNNPAASAADLPAAGYTAGATVNGITTYSRANQAASLSVVMSKAASGDTLTGTANGLTYTNIGSGTYAFDDPHRDVPQISADLTPAAGNTTTVTIKMFSYPAVVANIDSSGKLWATDGNPLYLGWSTTFGNSLTEDSHGWIPQADFNAVGGWSDVLSRLSNGNCTITVGSGVSAPTYTFPGGGAFAIATNLRISASALQAQASADNAAGHAINIGIGGTPYDVAAGTGGVTTGGTAVYVDRNAALTTSPVESLSVQGNGAVIDGNGNTVYRDLAHPGTLTLNSTRSNTSTTNPLAAIDMALAKVDDLRSSLGAIQNRLESIISNLGTTVSNLSSSRSRIQDADYAMEVSNMARANILQQAGTAVLAQANQTPQGILKLLQ